MVKAVLITFPLVSGEKVFVNHIQGSMKRV